MKKVVIAIAASVLALSVTLASAAPVVLKPANPQPSAGSLRKGLSVVYAYEDWESTGGQIDNLAEARNLLRTVPEPGKPLKGLDHWDTKKGDLVMTSKAWFNLAARIKGYIRFDEPGVYEIDFLVNDGIDAKIGGQKVGYNTIVQPCDPTSKTEVQVPSAGWYDLDAIYFQKAGTACLHMRWAKKGNRMKVVPNSAFAY